jgi:hypothetical protein
MSRNLETALTICALAGVAIGLALPALGQSHDVVTGAGAAGGTHKGGVRVAVGDVTGDGQAASGDYFLKIDTIKGESKDERHKDWIDVQSFSLGAMDMKACQGTGGPGTMTFKGRLPAGAAGAGKDGKILNAVMETAQTDGLLILRYMGVTLSPAARPSESTSLNYAKVTWTRPNCAGAKR